jgi:hypothetical protein
MIKSFLRRIRSFLVAPILQSLQTREIQVLLSLHYREMLRSGAPLPGFCDVGFSVFSQSDEDGILLYIFSLLGTTSNLLVDIGCGGLEGSNSANLIINHGWTGLLIDSNGKVLQATERFYAECFKTRVFPPVLVPARVTAENVNSLISDHGYSGEIDLLSLDIDGVDYWVWKAIACVNPRVVVVEYQDALGPARAWTVPYRPDFSFGDYQVNRQLHRDYAGASLPAFVSLAREKGYRLVGCNRYGFNAFFVRSGLGEACLPEVPATSCFGHPRNKQRMANVFPGIKDLDWTEV